MRLAVTDTFGWRNNANNGNLLLGVDASNNLTFNGNTFVSGSISALTGDVTATGPGSAVATVAAIQGTAVAGTTGSGNVVFNDSPSLITPDLGVPSALVGTNITGSAAGLSIGGNAATVTTNANLTGPVTSVGNATTIGPGAIDLGSNQVGGTLPNVNTTATAADVGSTIVQRDGSGNFAAGTVVADLQGNADTASLASTVTTNANLTGDVTSVGNATTLTNAAVIAKILTGYTSGAGVVSSADSILQAIQKLNGNMGALTTGVSSVFGRSGAVIAGSGDYSVAQVIGAAPLASPTFTGTVTIPSGSGLGTPTTLVGTNISGTAAALSIGGNAATATTAGSATTATTATNLAGGSGGTIPYQSAAGTTAMLANGTAGQILQANGTTLAPTWVAQPTTSPLTTKGDFYTYSTTNVRHAVPGDYGDLVPDSGQTDGWRTVTNTQLNGKPGKNYVKYSDFENGTTTGWTGTGCATVTNGLPVSVGSGGAAFSSSNGGRALSGNTNSPAVDSSSAVAGTYALNLATNAAGAIGDGYISSAYTIDPADRAKVLSYRAYYKVASGTPVMSGTSANTYAVAIYDQVNNSWLPITGGFNFVQSTGIGIAQGTCQTASNTTGIQIFVYSPVAPTGISSLLFDDVYIGPQVLAFGPPVSDAISYTLSITGSTSNPTKGTTTIDAAYWSRVGDSMRITYTIAQSGAGSAGSGTYIFGLPTGYTIDTNKLSVGTDPRQGVVGAAALGNTSDNFVGVVWAYSSAGLAVSVLNSTVGRSTVGSAFTPLSDSAAKISFEAIVPISGWSSNTVMSADSDTRVITAKYNNTAGTSITSTPTALPFATQIYDTSGSFVGSTGVYTVPVSGFYQISATIRTVSVAWTVNNAIYLNAYKNGSLDSLIGAAQGPSTATYQLLASGTSTVKCVAGDTLSVFVTSDISTTLNAAAGANNVCITRVSGPAVVAASEIVSARYTVPTGTLSGSFNIVKFTTKTWDFYGSSYDTSTGLFTAPSPGIYRVSASVLVSGTSVIAPWVLALQILNGATVQSYGACPGVNTSAAQEYSVSVSDEVNLLAGGTCSVKCYTQMTASPAYSSTSTGYISITKVR